MRFAVTSSVSRDAQASGGRRKDGIISCSISLIKVGRLGSSKFISGAGIQFRLRSGEMCLW